MHHQNLLLLLFLLLQVKSTPTPNLLFDTNGQPISLSDVDTNANANGPKFRDQETGELVDLNQLKQQQEELVELEKQQEKHEKRFSSITMRSTYTLLDREKIPVMGLGLYGIDPGDDTYYAIRNALANGYRYFDDIPHSLHTARDIGAAIRDSGISRKKIWIASKIALNGRTYDETLKDIKFIVNNLGITYLNVCLMESPKGGKIVERWDALNEARHLGEYKYYMSESDK